MTFSVLTSSIIPYLKEIKKKLEKRVGGLEGEKERGGKDFLFFSQNWPLRMAGCFDFQMYQLI